MDGLKEVLKTVKPKMDVSNVTMQSSLINDLAIDSLSMLLMSLAIETKFGIQFETKEPFAEVGDVVNYVQNALNK